MIIHYERSGGFAGIRTAWSVDAATLAPDAAKKLQELVDAADFFALPAVITSPTSGADRFQYTLTLETEGRRHTVAVSEAAVPVALRPLLTFVKTLGSSV